jgi:hypothetical protein
LSGLKVRLRALWRRIRVIPGKYESGAVIEGLDQKRDESRVQVFHAGTSRDAKRPDYCDGWPRFGDYGSGAERLLDALALCYSALEKIHWPGMQFRPRYRPFILTIRVIFYRILEAFDSAVILKTQFSPELKPPERTRRTSNSS